MARHTGKNGTVNSRLIIHVMTCGFNNFLRRCFGLCFIGL